ncbi:MAG: ribbon-helix-helix protein, CopG family [Vicinamibacteria bacterium]|nr:ribbon-helix-helix protein, CopG family [Vicinamibacteria bacterium]
MPLYSVRLDEASDDALAAAARQRKVSRAVILREAIAEYAGAAVRESSPFARLSSLIGVIEDGPGNLSEKTGKGFVNALHERRAGNTGSAARGPQRRRKRTSR